MCSHVHTNSWRRPLPWASVHWLVQCTLECHWNATGWPSVHWDTTGRPSEFSWNDPHWNATGETLTSAAYTGTPLEGLWQPTRGPTHILKHASMSSIHVSLKWQDGRTPVSKWTGFCIFSLNLEFTALQWIPVLLLTHVSASTSLCACLWYEHPYSFCVIWVASQRHQLSSNNSHHTRFIHKGSHVGKWPDLMTSKPDSVSTLGYHWTDHTGRPLEPQVHWDATGTTLADAGTQWCYSGDPVLICIIGTHWKTTGATNTLGCHWNHTGWC